MTVSIVYVQKIVVCHDQIISLFNYFVLKYHPSSHQVTQKSSSQLAYFPHIVLD